ncbi:putative nuclease HARBI1 [Eupeodes corollae]|uniref:putative nuclease HARBI1 n=1 Tax=Eupeodes corollae TaxID=290404 RepID=UPI002491AEAA|nr:putative nuclease HARBI1 [Eupeodes corollae]
MDSLAFAIIAITEEATLKKKKLKVQRKILRDACNPFELNDQIFQRNFRLNKAAFKYVLDLLKQEYDPGVFSSSISLICRLAAVLRFLGEGGYQLGVGNDYEVGMAQSTFSSNLTNVLKALERRLCHLWIQLEMTETEKRQAKREFYSRASFPGVIMCVDGTHINIVAPSEEKGLYYNRDAGYPLELWLMTPYRSAEAESAKSNYNTRHSKTRNAVERTIGVLKNRFRCILGARQLHYSPSKAAQIINVVCALHNICITYRVEDYTKIILPELEEQEVVPENTNGEETNTRRNAAQIMRDNIKNTFVQ